MRKNIRRAVAAVLVCAVAFGLVAGCGKKSLKGKTNNGKDKGDSDGSERVTLSVGIPQNQNISSYDDNAFTQYLEDNLNMDIQFVYYANNPADYATQLTLTASGGGDFPDVLYAFAGMSYYQCNEFGEDGYFIDLRELIEKNGTNFNAQMAKLSDAERELIEKKGTDPNDGAYYSMPRYKARAVDSLGCMMYINSTWLNKLNLRIPTTADELYAVLKAFATRDPNGNGASDEIPMLGLATGEYDISMYLINAYVYYDTYNGLNVTDGKVWDPVSSNEYREALKFASRLRQEGLLSEMCFTATNRSELIDLVTPSDGVTKVGIFDGHPLLYSSATTDLLKEYTALPFLKAATPRGGYTVERPQNLQWGNVITSSCEHPEAAMRFLDFMYNDETVTRGRHGEKGVDWEEGSGKFDYGTDGAKIKVLNPDAFTSGHTTWGQLGAGIETMENYLAIAETGQGRMADISRLLGESWKVMNEGAKPAETAVDMIYTNEEYETRDELSNLYNSYVKESRDLFIMGSQDINSDAEWNNYLNTLKNMGQDQLLETCQAAYGRK